MSHIVIVAGSPSRTSRLTGILQYVQGKLEQRGYKVSWIQVSELPAEDLILARYDSQAIKDANLLIEGAEAVIFASPVYKASYTGILKTYLDLLPQKALVGKKVLPLFIGGTIAHLLAIDYSIKPLLSILGASYQLAGVYAVDSQVVRNDSGNYDLAEELTIRLDRAIDDFGSIVEL